MRLNNELMFWNDNENRKALPKEGLKKLLNKYHFFGFREGFCF